MLTDSGAPQRTLSSRLSRVEGAVVDDAARSQVYKDLLLESRRQAISVHACKVRQQQQADVLAS